MFLRNVRMSSNYATLRYFPDSRTRHFNVDLTTDYVLDDEGVGVRVPVGSRMFSTSSRPALGPTQYPIQLIPGVLSPWVKRPGREAGQSIHPCLHIPSRRSAELVKPRPLRHLPLHNMLRTVFCGDWLMTKQHSVKGFS
jgi:hypothetical protein